MSVSPPEKVLSAFVNSMFCMSAVATFSAN